jgi:hypothetical protein
MALTSRPPERFLLIDKKWRRKYDALWRSKNRDKIHRQAREYYLKNIDFQRKRSRDKGAKELIEKGDIVRERNRRLSKTPKGIFRGYRKNAKRRGILFNISFDDFLVVFGKSCDYCGMPSLGIDRVDNSLGYESSNIRPCCMVCNHMKRNWSKSFLIEHCKKIIKHCEVDFD